MESKGTFDKLECHNVTKRYRVCLLSVKSYSTDIRLCDNLTFSFSIRDFLFHLISNVYEVNICDIF